MKFLRYRVQQLLVLCSNLSAYSYHKASNLPQDAQAVGNDVQVGFFAGIARGYREFGKSPPAGIGDGDDFQVDVEARAEFREVERLQKFRIVDNETAVAVRKFLPEGDVLERRKERAADALVEGHVAGTGCPRDEAARALHQSDCRGTTRGKCRSVACWRTYLDRKSVV